MENFDIYQDIAMRTQGDIYIGVVGPVRTGKSTFIRRFMDKLVLPAMEQGYAKERVVDELPQSGAGKSIMTSQPNFVPSEAVKIALSPEAVVSVRLVDCVGYLVKDAVGYIENDMPRMVHTPWTQEEMPFEQAAEMGTRKVIQDHSTIGIVVTTDGSITDIARSAYIPAEERVVDELKAMGKPFMMVLNSSNPNNPDTQRLKEALNEKYNVPVLAVDVMNMESQDILNMFEIMLMEFPIRAINIDLPEWVQALPADHWLTGGIFQRLAEVLPNMHCMRDHAMLPDAFSEFEHADPMTLVSLRLGEGMVDVHLPVHRELFYTVLGEACNFPIENDYQLVSMMKDLIGAKREYDRLKDALNSVRQTGYGLVQPTTDELVLEEPEIVRQGSRYGVKLKASAPSLHIMRVDIQTEVSPMMGSEKQSEELLQYLMDEFENNPGAIWSTNVFGKSLHELVQEGLSNKLVRMPEDVRMKIQRTLQRIVNEGSGGLICILL
ncbi:MAG: stage IV sporulation protein A [Bacillota bacterium]